MANQRKLLLLQDVEDLGRSGDIVTVRPGYARNYLLPRGYGVIADKNAVRMQDRLREERKQRAAVDLQESRDLAERLRDVTLSIHVKVDPDGHMYGSVSGSDILRLLEEQQAVTLEKRSVKSFPVTKKTGIYDVNLRLKEDVTAHIKLKVIPEGMVDLPVEESAPIEEPAAISEETTEQQ